MRSLRFLARPDCSSFDLISTAWLSGECGDAACRKKTKAVPSITCYTVLSMSLKSLKSLKTDELDFDYPERLVATERAAKSRVMLVQGTRLRELPGGVDELSEFFQPGDVLVINNTRVLKRRVFAESGLEILFLTPQGGLDRWQVLCPASQWPEQEEQVLPGGVRLKLLERGRPQTVEASQPLPERYFEQNGELPLPPYIQKARNERRNRAGDSVQYQTAWAQRDGSLAAPTASLHFSRDDLQRLEAKGVKVREVTLHVGLGTFLPIGTDDLSEHVMHAEFAEIPKETWHDVQVSRGQKKRIWALGTTVTRTLEAAAADQLARKDDGGFFGETALFIKPGFDYQIVTGLLTNFHQPRSTLLALVAAFADLETVKRCYAWAIENEFRLFSYGDLTVWLK